MTNKLIEAMARAMYSEAYRAPGNALTAKGAMSVAQAALKAISDAGYAIVPCEPSEAMWDAAMREGYDQDPATYYRAMISIGKAKA